MPVKLESWEFDVLRLYNPLRNGHLSVWMDFLRERAPYIPGDIVEAGVFQGKSLLAGAYVLQEVAPEKTIMGFDTFSGFPPVGVPEDDPARFDDLARSGLITKSHLARVERNMAHLKFLKGVERIDHTNVSLSNSFENTSQEGIERLSQYLGLTNLKLVKGPFEETMTGSPPVANSIAGAIFDCDLHGSYLTALEYVWPRLSPGGVIYLDEYYSLKFPGARIAVDSFFENIDAQFDHIVDDFNGFERWWVTKPN